MAKKSVSTNTKKAAAKKSSTSKLGLSKKEADADQTKRQKKKIAAGSAPAPQPGQKKKRTGVSTRKTTDVSSKTLVKENPVPEKRKNPTAAKKPSAQSAAKVVSSLPKKPVRSSKATASSAKAPLVADIPASGSANSKKLPPSPKSGISSPEGRKPPTRKSGLRTKIEPSLANAETGKPKSIESPPSAKPVARNLPPPGIEAPSQPHSVHVEEPLPTDQPAVDEEPSPATGHTSLFIVHITPEMAPIAKVGGLADVVFGLTRELAIRGNHVEIILPKYDNMRYDHIFDLQPDYHDLWVPWYEGQIHCTVYFGMVYDRKCFFIEPHSDDNFFNRGSIYGFKDDVLRYAFFSRAAMEFLWQAGKHPDIIHCHDWQTALAPVYLYEFYQRMGMTHPRACLTIHNFQHQGVTGGELLRATGLHQPERFFDYHRMHDNNHPKALNILKGGIVYSNFITTVSPHYAFESKDQGQGFGLEPTLHTHQIKYGGVVNGIDYDVWNPEVDGYIATRYGVDSIDRKYDNKRALRHRLMLADNNKPIVAFIGRLDPQKGLELVRHAIFYALERGAQFVLLGSSHDHDINSDFWGLKGMLNDSEDCHLEIGFDEELSHLIYAGADMMLVPSRFEPCGLTQLISLRYGTIPVVRSVGGLADTVFDKDHSNRPLHERNGYLFENYDQPGLESAFGRAIACYFDHPDHFRDLIKNAMRSDYSWNIPGRDYLNIYDYIREK